MRSARLLPVVLLLAVGCDVGGVDDSAPPCHPANAGGVWDVRWVDDGTGQISCDGASRAWTILQSGCDVTIESESWDPANGATGWAADGRLYVEWTWYQDCHGIRESVDATLSGDTMSGTFYRAVWQQVYPAYCPGSGICGAVLTGTRRAPTP